MNPDFSLLGGLKRKSDSIIYVRAEKIAKVDKIGVEVRKEPRDSDPSDLPEGQREPRDPTEGPLEAPNDGKETIQERFERIRAISAANAAAAAAGAANAANCAAAAANRNSSKKAAKPKTKPKAVYDWKKFIDEEDLRCLKCQQQLRSMYLLERHVKTHLDRRLYLCAICSYCRKCKLIKFYAN